jgi:hypothetical protein
MSDEQPTLSPRAGLRFILIRYDTDAGMAPGIWEVVKKIERHLAWIQHVNRARERDAARARPDRPIERPPTSRGVKSA